MFYIGFRFQDKLICCKMKLAYAQHIIKEEQSEYVDLKFCANSDKIGSIDRLSWLFYGGELDAIEVHMVTFLEIIEKVKSIGATIENEELEND